MLLFISFGSIQQLEFIGFSRYDGIRGIYEELMWRERYYWRLLHAMEVDKIADYSRVREPVG